MSPIGSHRFPDFELLTLQESARPAAVGLNLMLIPAFGALGAALGIFSPYLIKGVLRWAEISWLVDWRCEP